MVPVVNGQIMMCDLLVRNADTKPNGFPSHATIHKAFWSSPVRNAISENEIMTRKNVQLLFPETRKQRAKPRVLMHVFDAGGCDSDEGTHIARFECGKCGLKTDWLVMQTITETKRGIPCPNCNEEIDSNGK